MTPQRKAVTLVAAFVASLVFVLAGSGSASAAFECPRERITIAGKGASWQTPLQERSWIPGYTRECPEVTETFNGTGSGLATWGAEGFRERRFVANSGFDFIATDEPPTTAQLRNMSENAGGSAMQVFAVAQAPIGIVVNPPRECEISQISNEALERAFRGEVRWEAIGTGAGCRGAVRYVVRSDASATTGQFKHYLWLINRSAVEGTRTWLDLSSRELSTTWPGTPTVAGTSGAEGLVRTVLTTEGSIGYANLADAKAQRARTLRVLNGETFAEPQGTGEEGNCRGTVYRTRLGEGEATSATPESNWLEVFGSNPRIGRETIGEERPGREAYPICTLTFVVVPRDYGAAGFPTPEIKRQSVKAALTFVFLSAWSSLFFGPLTRAVVGVALLFL